MMSGNDLVHVRTALLVTLGILLVVILWRRFRQRVLDREMPAPLHAELVDIELAYHPARLNVVIHMPEEQDMEMTLLDAVHRPIHRWPAERLCAGRHRAQRALPDLPDGPYHLELATSTQRTVRQFRLQQE